MTLESHDIAQYFIGGFVALIFWQIRKLLREFGEMKITVAVIDSKVHAHSQLEKRVDKHRVSIIRLRGSAKRAHERLDILESQH